jgi:adenosyl cobinamide kinase/adenosyl cobinamide phosphate guanylyltransferase
MPLTLLFGGVRSGKSRLAVRLAKSWDGPVVMIATGEPRDEEMSERIRRHRAERPRDWGVVEEPVELEEALAQVSGQAFLLVDCLTLWVSNLMEGGLSGARIEERAARAASLAAAREPPCLAVTNEVGSGIVPASDAARRFSDVLGRVNAIWAEEAERVFLVAAGRVVPLLDPADLFKEHPDG